MATRLKARDWRPDQDDQGDQGDQGEAVAKPISRALLRRLGQRLRPRRASYGMVCLAGLVIAALDMVPPRLVGDTVNELVAGKATVASVLTTAALWAAAVVVIQSVAWLQIGLASRAGERVLAALRVDVLSHLQAVPISFFDRTHPGKIIARASNDIEMLRHVVSWGINTILANLALILLSGAMLALTDLRLFLAVCWLAPAMLLLSFAYSSRVGLAWQRVLRHSAKVSSNQAENIAGIRVVKAFNREHRNLDQFRRLNRINTTHNLRASALNGSFQATLQLVRFLGLLIILLYGGYRVATGDLQAGSLVAATLYWDWFMHPATNAGIFMSDLMMAMAGAERVFALLDLPVSATSQLAEAPLELERGLAGHVRFQKLTFGYVPGRPVLRELDLDVPAGACVGLVGTTGSGKSTIISLLARFYQPSSGRITVDGHDLGRISASSLHRQIALVPQHHFLFHGTVLDNLRFGCPEATREEVMAAARALGCHERFLALKQGYDTQVGERGSALSLGERQLVCFTRAMVLDPRILLLDEATSSVDPDTERQLSRAMAALMQGRTTFIVAHRLSTIVKSDLIVVLEQGRIIERGDHEALLRGNGKYAELVRHYHDDSMALIT